MKRLANAGVRTEMNIIFAQNRNFAKGYQQQHSMCARCHIRRVTKDHLYCKECEEDHGDTSR